jgi:hypothetical protein
MRALTQGCEDGGDIWLSHIGVNEIVAGRMWLMKALVVVANVKGSCYCGSGCVCVQDRERERQRGGGWSRSQMASANLLCFAEPFRFACKGPCTSLKKK